MAAIEEWERPFVDHGFLVRREDDANGLPLRAEDDLIAAAQRRVSLLRELYSRDDLAQHAGVAGGTVTRAGRSFISAVTARRLLEGLADLDVARVQASS